MGNYPIKKPDKNILLVALFFFLLLNNAQAQDNSDLFLSVFGNSPDSLQVISVPLYINDQYSDDINIQISLQENYINIDALHLIGTLEKYVHEEVLNNIKLNINHETDTVNQMVLDDLGLTTFYNQRELSLFIDIPVELKEEIVINLKQNETSSSGTKLQPSPFSAYINLFSSLNLNITNSPSAREILLPFNLGFDSAVNVKSLVFEGDIQMSFKDTVTVSSWHATMIKDIVSRNIRMKGGTINYPVTMLQSYVPLNGITISRNFSLNPYGNIQSLGQKSIILNTPSEVEIYINGRLLKTLNLPKGRYNLENMQLDSGANNIEIKIIEINGEEHSIYFFQPFSISILKKGLFDFSSTMGIYKTEMDTPYYTGYFRYGLSHNLTIGANFQSDFAMLNGGLSFLLGTAAGNFSIEGSFSYDSGPDWAASFFYRYTNSRLKYKNNWALTAVYRGVNYTGLRLEKITNTYPLRLSAYYGQVLPGNINAGLTINRNFDSSWSNGNTEFILFLSRHFNRGLQVNLFASEKLEDNGDSNFSAGISLTVNFQERNETITTSSSWPGAAIDSTWQKSSDSRIRGYSVNAGISGLPSSAEYAPYGLTLGGEFKGYKFTTSFNHNSSFLNIDNNSLHNSTINFNSALVLAGSTLAITRPVYDSFIIFKPSETFKQYSIGINPEGKSYAALLHGRGNAVLPDLYSYRNSLILLEAIDLPIGYDLGESAYTFTPTYKSGTVITVGSSAVIFAGGIMIDENGLPRKLSPFSVRALDQENIEERMFFTNRDGYFEIYGLTSGQWIIELIENRDYQAVITIPGDTTGYFELSNVNLRKGENK